MARESGQERRGGIVGDIRARVKNEERDGAAAKTISLLQQPRRSREWQGNEETERKGIVIKKATLKNDQHSGRAAVCR